MSIHAQNTIEELIREWEPEKLEPFAKWNKSNLLDRDSDLRDAVIDYYDEYHAEALQDRTVRDLMICAIYAVDWTAAGNLVDLLIADLVEAGDLTDPTTEDDDNDDLIDWDTATRTRAIRTVLF